MLVVAEVSDDGREFDPASVRPGVGLSAMRERIEGLGGEIELESAPGGGARVRLRVGGAPCSPSSPRDDTRAHRGL